MKKVRTLNVLFSYSVQFEELSGTFVGKLGLSLKQQGKIHMCCVRPVLLYCCEMWELTVADEASLHRVEHRMIYM